jgi:hypothetical protein
LIECVGNGITRQRWKPGCRLADFEMQDPATGGLTFARGPTHRHRMKWWN